MPSLKERTTALIQRDRTESFRQFSDEQHGYCFYATMYELIAFFEQRKITTPRVSSILRELAHSSRSKYFNTKETVVEAQRVCNEHNIEITRICMTPVMAENIVIPENLQSLVVITQSKNVRVNRPAVLILNSPNENSSSLHMEAMLDTHQNVARNELTYKQGFTSVAMMIEFKKKN